MPKNTTILSAATRSIIQLVERRSSGGVHRREWAALAIAAAKRGGLPEQKLRELRDHFRDPEDAAKGSDL